MDKWALIISIVALGLSGASVWYTRRSATIEMDRRHDENEPTFTAEVTDVNNDGGFLRLEVTLSGPRPLDEIQAVLPTRGGVHFTRGQSGVAADSDGLTATSYSGPIDKGDATMWRVEMDQDHPSALTFKITSKAGTKDSWMAVETVELPYNIMDSIG